jgi:uncharacterized membrane protein (DUF441 family)
MNDRIDKLLVEAGAYFGGEGVVYDTFDPKKFAELLIQQCAHVAVFKDSGTVATAAVAGHMAAGRSIAAKLIKEHFGVEE